MCNKCDKKADKNTSEYKSHKKSFEYYEEYTYYKKSCKYYSGYQSHKKNYKQTTKQCYTSYKKSYKHYEKIKSYKKSYKHYVDFKSHKKSCKSSEDYKCKKVDDRCKDWKPAECYEEKKYKIERKYLVKEQKYLIEEKRYDCEDKEEKCEDKKEEKCEKKEKKCEKPKKECCVIDKCLLNELECLWKQFSHTASADLSKGVILLSHGLPVHFNNTINGLAVHSPLVSHGLYSVECSEGKYVNLYEVIIPDIPGAHGHDSTGKIFTKILAKYNIFTDGDHFHWKGHQITKKQTIPDAIHVVKIDLHPVLFTKVIIKALKKVLHVIKARTQHHDVSSYSSDVSSFSSSAY